MVLTLYSPNMLSCLFQNEWHKWLLLNTGLFIYSRGSTRMSPLLSLHSLQELKHSRQFQGLLLIVRLLLIGILAWQVYDQPDFSAVFINQNIHVALGVYGILAIINYLAMLFRPTSARIFYLGIALDYCFAVSLLFLLPNQASVILVMAMTFVIAAYSDLKLSLLTMVNASYIVAAVMAGFIYNTLDNSQLQPIHLTGFSIFALGYLHCFKQHLQTSTNDLKGALNSGILQKKQLVDALTYLYPYHQRNQIPLSLLMIRVETATRAKKEFVRALFAGYKHRLRKCDVLVQLDRQHLAILLCDTSAAQTGHVVKALGMIKDEMHQPDIRLQYGVCPVPLEHEIALEDILLQMMTALNEAEIQNVNRLIFINAKQSD